MNNIVLIGMKNSGKSTLARSIATHHKMNLAVIDDAIESLHEKTHHERLSVREINKQYGREYFFSLETQVIRDLLKTTRTVIDCSGSAPLREENRQLLKQLGPSVWLRVEPTRNYERLIKNGIPSFFKYPDDPKRSFDELWKEREPIYAAFADRIIDAIDETPEQLLERVEEMHIV